MIGEKTKMTDVREVVRNYMRFMLDTAENKGRWINWKKFEAYCKEFRNECHPLNVPVSVIDECLKHIKRENYNKEVLSK